MKLTFLGAAHEVTGSSTLLEACGKKILIDCGMEQGADIYENCALPISPSLIDAICLTHAHIDHSGMIPAMVAKGFSGPIYTTEATGHLCNIMLRDSAHIQEFEAEWRNRKAARAGKEPYVPLYTMADAMRALELFDVRPYGETVQLFDGITMTLSDAGHLLGSASIRFNISEDGESKSIIFSGDLGNVDRPLIRDPQMPENADYVVVESTYGNRHHGERPDYLSQLVSILTDTFTRGGNVVIPAFAVGRTQELLFLMREIKEKNLVPGFGNFPVYVDSPLAVEATNIYSRSSALWGYYDKETLALLERGVNPIRFEGLKLSVTSDESKQINFDNTPKVIISASGMCEAGRIRHHLKHNLWREDSTVLFVGYQSEGTVGRKLTDGESVVRLFNEDITVRAKICSLAGISGHADQGILMRWLGAMDMAPKMVFVNHGEDTVCDEFAAEIRSRLGFDACAPYSGDEFDLCAAEFTFRAPVKKIEKKPRPDSRAQTVFDKLLAAGKRLLAVIEKNRGGANKDLAKFTSQINDLCDKYDK